LIRGNTHSKLFSEIFDVNKVNAGKFKNNYFLNALAIIGEENVKECFPEQKYISGASLVRFKIHGKDFYVIVDNYFPALKEKRKEKIRPHWIFSHSYNT